MKLEPPAKSSLVPVETFLLGGWISLVLTVRVAVANHLQLVAGKAAHRLDTLLMQAAREDRLLALQQSAAEMSRGLFFKTSLAEALLGVFLVLLALRRQARGLALLLPFSALALALLDLLLLAPETARLGRALEGLSAAEAAARARGLTWLLHAGAGLDVVQVLVLFAMFLLLARKALRR